MKICVKPGSQHVSCLNTHPDQLSLCSLQICDNQDENDSPPPPPPGQLWGIREKTVHQNYHFSSRLSPWKIQSHDLTAFPPPGGAHRRHRGDKDAEEERWLVLGKVGAAEGGSDGKQPGEWTHGRLWGGREGLSSPRAPNIYTKYCL